VALLPPKGRREKKKKGTGNAILILGAGRIKEGLGGKVLMWVVGVSLLVWCGVVIRGAEKVEWGLSRTDEEEA